MMWIQLHLGKYIHKSRKGNSKDRIISKYRNVSCILTILVVSHSFIIKLFKTSYYYDKLNFHIHIDHMRLKTSDDTNCNYLFV